VGTGGYLPGILIDGRERRAGEIAVVDSATWKVVDRVPLRRYPEVMELDADGRWLAVASANSGEVVILDADTLDVRRRVALSVGDSFWAMSFSPDGRLLAGAGESGKVHIIDTGAWEAREAVPVRDGPTIQLEWLRDNRTVLSTSGDGDVLLFDTERALVRTPPLPASVNGQPGFAHLLPGPDDEIVLFNDDRVGLRYPTAPADWLREVCAIAGRDLTRVEWDRYLSGREYRATCTDLD
jgi:WD40 repeat protein